MLSTVDLPQPEGPMSERNSPGRTSRLTSRSAVIGRACDLRAGRRPCRSLRLEHRPDPAVGIATPRRRPALPHELVRPQHTVRRARAHSLADGLEDVEVPLDAGLAEAAVGADGRQGGIEGDGEALGRRVAEVLLTQDAQRLRLVRRDPRGRSPERPGVGLEGGAVPAAYSAVVNMAAYVVSRSSGTSPAVFRITMRPAPSRSSVCGKGGESRNASMRSLLNAAARAARRPPGPAWRRDRG